MKAITKGAQFVTLLTMSIIVGGCSQSPERQSQVQSVTGENKISGITDKKDSAKLDHSGWWCKEHGVPESECGQCSSKLAKQFQKDGDWCKAHDRPDSQCFICHPEKEAVFAAKYEAKFGKQPPKTHID